MCAMRWRALACISILCCTTVCAHADVRTSSVKPRVQVASSPPSGSGETFAHEFAFALRYRSNSPSRTARLIAPFQNAAKFVGAKLFRIR